MSNRELDKDEWLVLLRGVLQEYADVLPKIQEAGFAAYTWRSIDAELAAMTYDSCADDPVALTRSPEHAELRALSFSSPSLSIELEIGPARVLGQLVPPQFAAMELTPREGDPMAVSVDEIGCFTIEPLPDVPFRLAVMAQPTVLTDWITLSGGSDHAREVRL